MRIYVVDDTMRHLDAAQAQLGAEHKVTTFETYGDLLDALRNEPAPDAVLSDLRMPGEAMTLGREGMKHFGVEFDAGMFIVFLAATYHVKFVAVATDLNHHDHPASAFIDHLGGAFSINGTRAMIVHAPMRDGTKDWAAVLALLLQP